MLKLISFILYFYLLLSNTLPTAVAQSTLNPPCAHNEIYYNRTKSPTCDVNCQDLSRVCRLTNERAVAGCYCQLGYARNLRQQCIPVNECRRDCFINEVPIYPRQRDCEKTCRTLRGPSLLRICYSIKERRCVCALQHCRNHRGQCVRDLW